LLKRQSPRSPRSIPDRQKDLYRASEQTVSQVQNPLGRIAKTNIDDRVDDEFPIGVAYTDDWPNLQPEPRLRKL
jgi:hypothetical protein